MTRELRIEYPGAFYHVLSRGNEKKPIYSDDDDKKMFLSYFNNAYTRYKSVIHLYCLMNNHYHVVLETPLGNLSKVMHFINASYATYFNKKHERCGHLLQSRYKAILIQEEQYLMELSRYIHLNPVRAGITSSPDYPWSSYNAYIGTESPPAWLNTNLLLSNLGTGNTYKKYESYVAEAQNIKTYNPLKLAKGSLILGSDEFVRNIKRIFLDKMEESRDLPAIHRIMDREYNIHDIIKATEKIFADEKEQLKRSVSIHVSHKHSGLSLREIGEYFGISESGVSQASRRVSKRMTGSAQLHRGIERIIGLLNRGV